MILQGRIAILPERVQRALRVEGNAFQGMEQSLLHIPHPFLPLPP
jgi:hypothetical protein